MCLFPSSSLHLFYHFPFNNLSLFSFLLLLFTLPILISFSLISQLFIFHLTDDKYFFLHHSLPIPIFPCLFLSLFIFHLTDHKHYLFSSFTYLLNMLELRGFSNSVIHARFLTLSGETLRKPLLSPFRI